MVHVLGKNGQHPALILFSCVKSLIYLETLIFKAVCKLAPPFSQNYRLIFFLSDLLEELLLEIYCPN